MLKINYGTAVQVKLFQSLNQLLSEAATNSVNVNVNVSVSKTELDLWCRGALIRVLPPNNARSAKMKLYKHTGSLSG